MRRSLALAVALPVVTALLLAPVALAQTVPPPARVAIAARGTVGLAVEVTDATELAIDDPTDSPYYQVRVRSNHAWALYALGQPEQLQLVRWPTSTRNFVVPLRGLGQDATADGTGSDIYERYFFAVTSR